MGARHPSLVSGAPEAGQKVEHLEVQPDDRGEQTPGRIPLHERGAPPLTPRSTTAKSMNRLRAATMQITTLIAIPAGEGSVQNRRSTPKMLRIQAVR
jgi:hypothetical protein